jgi:nucleotide-binding universal stress UspA family protein
MYRDILVAIDDSDICARALEHAGALAAALNARLTVLSVAPHVPAFAYAATGDLARLEAEAIKAAETTVRRAVEHVPDGVGVTTVVRTGSVGREIVDQVERGRHDLVVLGSRGRGRLASGVLGSVVGDVHFGAHVPLLIVHPDAGPRRS